MPDGGVVVCLQSMGSFTSSELASRSADATDKTSDSTLPFCSKTSLDQHEELTSFEISAPTLAASTACKDVVSLIEIFPPVSSAPPSKFCGLLDNSVAPPAYMAVSINFHKELHGRFRFCQHQTSSDCTYQQVVHQHDADQHQYCQAAATVAAMAGFSGGCTQCHSGRVGVRCGTTNPRPILVSDEAQQSSLLLQSIATLRKGASDAPHKRIPMERTRLQAPKAGERKQVSKNPATAIWVTTWTPISSWVEPEKPNLQPAHPLQPMCPGENSSSSSKRYSAGGKPSNLTRPDNLKRTKIGFILFLSSIVGVQRRSTRKDNTEFMNWCHEQKRISQIGGNSEPINWDYRMRRRLRRGGTGPDDSGPSIGTAQKYQAQQEQAMLQVQQSIAKQQSQLERSRSQRHYQQSPMPHPAYANQLTPQQQFAQASDSHSIPVQISHQNLVPGRSKPNATDDNMGFKKADFREVGKSALAEGDRSDARAQQLQTPAALTTTSFTMPATTKASEESHKKISLSSDSSGLEEAVTAMNKQPAALQEGADKVAIGIEAEHSVNDNVHPDRRHLTKLEQRAVAHFITNEDEQDPTFPEHDGANTSEMRRSSTDECNYTGLLAAWSGYEESAWSGYEESGQRETQSSKRKRPNFNNINPSDLTMNGSFILNNRYGTNRICSSFLANSNTTEHELRDLIGDSASQENAGFSAQQYTSNNSSKEGKKCCCG
ncbi:hypothetical protein K490DRAFT_59651 [Saccharata proteae CBS 121410]|uniref:Uncharacterized protein n=1 Tax=Saccharata proteae CBS 121410 TaxID=1314787 RepID=A0A9P4HR01_9PEZI|nr:hypothetical protein K490DRAFT_59651 [Saccharata proteae CBS 121410]